MVRQLFLILTRAKSKQFLSSLNWTPVTGLNILTSRFPGETLILFKNWCPLILTFALLLVCVLLDVNIAPSPSGNRWHLVLKPITQQQGKGAGQAEFQGFSGKRWYTFVTGRDREVWHALSLIMSLFSPLFNVIVFLTLRSGPIEIKTSLCGTA